MLVKIQVRVDWNEYGRDDENIDLEICVDLIDDNYEIINWGEDLTKTNPSSENNLVVQHSHMSILTKSELEYSSIKNVFSS